MKTATTEQRLREIMMEKNMRQVDVLEKAQVYCLKYGIKLQKSDLSQYLSGKIEPSQTKLFILGKTLGVSEGWLMGYDVPKYNTNSEISVKKNTQTQLYYINDEASIIAQELHDRPELKVLFDASRKVSAKDLQFVIDMLDRFKNEE